MPGVRSMMPARSLLPQPAHERMDVQAQFQVEYHAPVFHQHIAIARAPIDDRGPARAGRKLARIGYRPQRLRAALAASGGRKVRWPTSCASVRAPRPLRRQALESHAIAGTQLPQLPQLGLDERRRTDEAAEARVRRGPG